MRALQRAAVPFVQLSSESAARPAWVGFYDFGKPTTRGGEGAAHQHRTDALCLTLAEEEELDWDEDELPRDAPGGGRGGGSVGASSTATPGAEADRPGEEAMVDLYTGLQTTDAVPEDGESYAELKDRADRTEAHAAKLDRQLKALAKKVCPKRVEGVGVGGGEEDGAGGRETSRTGRASSCRPLIHLPHVHCTHHQAEVLGTRELALKRNISCLFKTAKLEIERKDREIKRLRGLLASAGVAPEVAGGLSTSASTAPDAATHTPAPDHVDKR